MYKKNKEANMFDKFKKVIDYESWLATYDGEDKIISSHEAAKLLNETQSPFKFYTKIPSFDQLMDGFEAGELIVISGKTKHGKTLWAQTLTRNFERQGYKCLWFSYELPLRQFLSRFPDLPLFYLPYHLVGKDSAFIEKKIWEAKLKYECNIIFIDHLGFLQDNENARDKRTEIDTLVRKLKGMAIKHNVVIFLLWHNRRPSEWSKKEPNEDDLKESSGIAQDSDATIMVARVAEKINGEEDWNTGKGKVSVILSRRSGVMRKSFFIKLVNGYFEELEERYAPIELKEKYDDIF